MKGLKLDSIQDEIAAQVKDLDFSILGDCDTMKDEAEREEAWRKKRLGRFTSSEFHRLMGYEDDLDFPQGAITYVKEKVIELSTQLSMDGYSDSTMDWGSDHEKEAVFVFMEKTGIEVSFFGEHQDFIEKGKHLGGTPDGLIIENRMTVSGIETKCPNSKTHLTYILELTAENFKEKCKNYYWQCLGNMYMTGAKYWYFISYDPRFNDEKNRLFWFRIDRNEKDLLNFRRRYGQAVKMKEEMLSKLNTWEQKKI